MNLTSKAEAIEEARKFMELHTKYWPGWDADWARSARCTRIPRWAVPIAERPDAPLVIAEFHLEGAAAITTPC